jgi:hypothetical protein
MVRMGRNPSGRKRWTINLWLSPEERAEIERRLTEQGVRLAPELLRLLRRRVDMPEAEGGEE